MSDQGYDFVPLPDSVRRVERRSARHDKSVAGTISATATFKLVTEQPLHIGSGFKKVRDERVVRAAISQDGAPVVLGSTFKGLLRSRYEAITRSCVPIREKDGPVSVRSSSFGNVEAQLSPMVRDLDVLRPCSGRGNTCPACALFGRMSLRGRVAVRDLIPKTPIALEIAEVAELYAPNLHHVGKFAPIKRGALLEVRELHGRKFARGRGPETQSREPIEVIPAGSSLAGEMRLVNVTEVELGGIIAALGVLPQSRLKIGGGRGHGFGRARVEDLALSLRTDTAPVPQSWEHYEGAFRSSLDAWLDGLDALVRIHDAASNP